MAMSANASRDGMEPFVKSTSMTARATHVRTGAPVWTGWTATNAIASQVSLGITARRTSTTVYLPTDAATMPSVTTM